MNKLHHAPSIIYQITMVLALILATFQISTALFGLLPAIYQRAIHWCLMANIIFVFNLANIRPGRKLKNSVLIFADLIGLVSVNIASIYICFNYQEIFLRVGISPMIDCVCGLLLVISVMIAGFVILGWPLPVLSLICLVYAFMGQYIPGLLWHHYYAFERVVSFLYLGTEGIYGIAMNVSAVYIYLFVLLGAFMEASGAGRLFVNLTYSLTWRFKGGTAQAAVLSGTLMGLISGSGTANTVTMGTFTIPMLRKVGYSAEKAGAIQAVSSNIGQLLPPVMGAVVFLLMEKMGISYMATAKAMVSVSMLYVFIVAFGVYFDAKKCCYTTGLDEAQKFWPLFKKGFYYLLPIVVIVIILATGVSAVTAGIYALFATLVLSLLNRDNMISASGYREIFFRVAQTMSPIITACACAGIIIGVITLTNLGVKITSLIVLISGGGLYVAASLLMICSLVLGLSMPTSAVYLVTAVLGVPALVNMGATALGAHVLLIFFALMSPLTPPVGLSCAAVCALTNGGFGATCLRAIKIVMPTFIVPLVALRYNGLLFQGSLAEAMLPFGLALLSGIMLAACVTGYYYSRLYLWERALLAVGSVLLLTSRWQGITMGFVIAFLMICLEMWRNRRRRDHNRENI